VALTDEAIGKIKEMIISGRVRPGEKLPKEADLAAELGLSRNSLREAVKALTLVNVLDVRQGDGTYATSLAPSLLLEALSFIIDFHRDDTVLEFFEVRRILEPAATGLAALRMSPEEKAELGKILDAVTVESPVDDFVATDLEFHKKIAVGSGNSVLASLVDNMSLPTARARIWRGMTEPGALERTLAEHRAIHGAILSGDADLARSWATVHIGGIESWLRTTLTELSATPSPVWRWAGYSRPNRTRGRNRDGQSCSMTHSTRAARPASSAARARRSAGTRSSARSTRSPWAWQAAASAG
jgi:DNA-binding FadR family transcriptional regulator